MSDTQLYINQRPVRLQILGIRQRNYENTYKGMGDALNEFVQDLPHFITNVEWSWLIDNGVPMLDPGLYLTGILNNSTTVQAYDMGSRRFKPVAFNENCNALYIVWNYQD